MQSDRPVIEWKELLDGDSAWLILEPYYGGSHKLWADNLVSRSGGRLQLWTLPARNWKWRMYHAAFHFAERFRQEVPEVQGILCSSMMDLSVFKALVGLENLKYAYYMHENQLLYPESPSDKDSEAGRDYHYSFIQIQSCAGADGVFFNSFYHLEAWYDGIEDLLNKLPPERMGFRIDEWRRKSGVAYIPLDLSPFGQSSILTDDRNEHLTLLWNHRWEYDKGPEAFFSLLEELHEQQFDFQLIILGTMARQYPEVFDKARERFRSEIVHIGTVESRADYVRWLRMADVLPVTSIQDFFGISIVEAMAAGVIPLLPDRLSYPELLGRELSHLLYEPGTLASRILEFKLDGSVQRLVAERAMDFHDVVLEQSINESR